MFRLLLFFIAIVAVIFYLFKLFDVKVYTKPPKEEKPIIPEKENKEPDPTWKVEYFNPNETSKESQPISQVEKTTTKKTATKKSTTKKVKN